MAFVSSVRAQAQPDATHGPGVGSDWVEITLVTDEPHLGLYAREPGKVTLGDEVGDSWAFVCAAPCGVRVDPRFTYRVMGDKIVPSIHFNLAPGAGHVALEVHPTRPGSHTVGAVLAVTGAVLAFGGVLMLLADAVESSVANGLGGESGAAESELSASAKTYGNIGIGLVAAGAVLGATSLIFLLSGKTNLTPTDVSSPKTTAHRVEGLHAIPFGFAF
jgi:hypothetical protein